MWEQRTGYAIYMKVLTRRSTNKTEFNEKDFFYAKFKKKNRVNFKVNL